MTKAQRRGSGESTKDAWLQIGYEVLAEEGFKALKLDVITARLGVTRGSFYWHFADMAAYKAALVANWAQWRDEDHQLMGDLAELAPRDRLIKMMSVLLSPRYWTLERAMREWARSDATAASSVLAADRRVQRAVRQAFLDAGFDEKTARQRADWIFAMGVGALHLASKRAYMPAAERAELVDFMLRP
ncbi:MULTISPECIES: TetR/AcrR family transcriptional regulator [Mycobacterium]|uniref:TetR family transcriptional regulator n=1 Tax=Mycobacterium kiyosense TaxID=2871094 RepID=A0A9P3UW49_9MYCO|nr:MULTISPECIES: TetR/AcrR family transcriptional regulator [Mycobacterium]BDB41017.1 TetR family transcriptional regulator [Mycobacterium kiyosense]BDE12816.1 TetR family transcriptional regulator [Mycobacterium sp. 20KCMC460]GLB82490.1 TetR family transcriptional regulator [Mycobacterium kiyosense]GLB90305.1 TetR family transcriptional regulator [Mycobacterium kiyosense]GLB93908.1 TetR family transcriptional regulator [Mycobacterium kiyosense]